MQLTLAESIFKFPKLYQKKVQLLAALNGQSQNELNELISNQEVLDLGCGSFQFFYEPKNAKRLVGMDYVPEAIEGAKQMYPEAEYRVGSATDPLPFESKSFDVVMLLFMIHHLPQNSIESLLKETLRVARKKVVIYDHTKADRGPKALIQQTYWDKLDGGKKYRTEQEWIELLKPYKITKYLRKGLLFKNICYYEISER